MRLDLRQRDEHPAGRAHRRGASARARSVRVVFSMPRHAERRAWLVALDVEYAIVVHRDERHTLFARHRLVARDAHELHPVGVIRAPTFRDGDVCMSTRLQASDDAPDELGIRDAPAHAVIAVVLARVLEPIEAADVRLEQDGRIRGDPRDLGFANALAEIARGGAGENRDRAVICCQASPMFGPKRVTIEHARHGRRSVRGLARVARRRCVRHHVGRGGRRSRSDGRRRIERGRRLVTTRDEGHDDHEQPDANQHAAMIEWPPENGER